MRARRLILALAPFLAACGGDPEPPMPTGTKTVPTVEEHYQRRDLVTWRALAGDLPREERIAQMWALGELETDPLESIDLLLERLGDADPSVQLAAVVTVGRLAPASPRVAERLVALFGGPEEALRRHARLAVANLGEAAVEPLRAALASETLRVRWGAVTAAGACGAACAPLVGELTRLARADEHASVRRQARFSLARLGPSGIDACVELMRGSESTDRAELATALARAGPGVVEPMARLLGDEDEDLAARAAGVLVDLGTQALPALDALLDALKRAGPVRFNSAEALIAIGAPAIAKVKPLIESDDEGLAGIARYIVETWEKR
ncbi:MAG: hypothetical protein QNJ90_00760 [Planctomycetota bacterium]|nr:hypothetical protein [Planctomycetota bacterium]